MAPSPWTFHAGCLRGGAVETPAGPAEIVLFLSDNFDLAGPEPGQVLRLSAGTVLYAEIDAAAGAGLMRHLAGSRAQSDFRFAIGLMLGLDEAHDQVEAKINDWIDEHVAVTLLPVVGAMAADRPLPQCEGFLNGLGAAWLRSIAH